MNCAKRIQHGVGHGIGMWVCGLLIYILSHTPGIAQEVLTAVSPGTEHPVYIIASRILPEAAGTLGYTVRFRAAPILRAIDMVDTSMADIYLFSDMDYALRHPKQVRVDMPIAHDDIVVFSNKVNFRVDGWSSLKPYRVGYMIGMAVVEKNIDALNREGAQTPELAFAKLITGRSDVVVMPKALGLLYRKRYPGVFQLSGAPLVKVPLFIYLSPKRAGLAPRLAASLKQLQLRGRIDEIARQVEANL